MQAQHVHAIDPARLAYGAWCHHRDRQVGEGDIIASYSADHIGMGKPIRPPFRFQGMLWVTVGMRSRHGAEAYALVHASGFKEPSFSYADRCRHGDGARADRRGFYHGMRVRHWGEDYVLSGPPHSFIAGQQEQLTLF